MFINCFYLLHNKTNKFLGINQDNLVLVNGNDATDFDYKQIGNYYAIFNNGKALTKENNSIVIKSANFNKKQAFNFKIDENLNLFLLDVTSCFQYKNSRFIKSNCTDKTDTYSIYFRVKNDWNSPIIF